MAPRYPLDGMLQFSEVTVDATTGTVTLRAQFPIPTACCCRDMFVRATIVEGVEPKPHCWCRSAGSP